MSEIWRGNVLDFKCENLSDLNVKYLRFNIENALSKGSHIQHWIFSDLNVKYLRLRTENISD